jgi:uncharacterized protein
MDDLERSRKDRGARVPAELLDAVVAYFDPRRVILFGSHARGEAGPDSDIDLLVVVDDDTPAEKVTLHAGMEARSGYRRPADVFPVTEETFRRKCGIPGTLARAALLDGVTVYEKVPAEVGGTEPDPAVGWLRTARNDTEVARACLGMLPPKLGVAVYHWQQGGRKSAERFSGYCGC